MTIAVQQVKYNSGQGGSSPFTASFTSLPTAGHSVIVVVSVNMGSSTFTAGTMTDNQGVGNTYTLLSTIGDTTTTSAYAVSQIWWCQSIGATSGTFTVSLPYTGTTTGGNNSLGLVEVSGLTGTDQIGTSSGGGSITTRTATCSAANTSANALVVGGIVTNYYGAPNSITSPPSTGYTLIGSVTSGVASSYGYKIVSAIETSSVTASWGGSQIAVGNIVTFKGAAAANTNQMFAMF